MSIEEEEDLIIFGIFIIFIFISLVLLKLI
jgi:hypothetical protein